jgi:thymidylate synthase
MIAMTRQFKSFNEAFATLAIELLNDGQNINVINSVGDTVTTRELQNYELTFAPNYSNICTLPLRKFPVKGAQAEFLWYMTGNNNAKLVSKFLPNWLNYANEI